MGLFHSSFEDKDSDDSIEKGYSEELHICPECNRKSLYRYEITANYRYKGHSYIEITYWIETEKKENEGGPGPEARIAWRKFHGHIVWHEGVHKENFEDFLEEVGVVLDELNSTIYVGEACAQNNSDAMDLAQSIAVDAFNSKVEELNRSIDNAKEKKEGLDKEFDDNDKEYPGNPESPLQTIKDLAIVIEQDNVNVVRWEEKEIKIKLKRVDPSGFRTYRDQITEKKWEVEAPEGWVYNEEDHTLTGKPIIDDLAQRKVRYLEENGFLAIQVKYSETLDGSTEVFEMPLKIEVKSWQAEIDVNKISDMEFIFGVKNGIPKVLNPSYTWRLRTAGVPVMAIPKNDSQKLKKETIHVIFNTSKEKYILVNESKKFFSISLIQKARGVEVKPDGITYRYKLKKKKK